MEFLKEEFLFSAAADRGSVGFWGRLIADKKGRRFAGPFGLLQRRLAGGVEAGFASGEILLAVQTFSSQE